MQGICHNITNKFVLIHKINREDNNMLSLVLLLADHCVWNFWTLLHIADSSILSTSAHEFHWGTGSHQSWHTL